MNQLDFSRGYLGSPRMSISQILFLVLCIVCPFAPFLTHKLQRAVEFPEEL